MRRSVRVLLGESGRGWGEGASKGSRKREFGAVDRGFEFERLTQARSEAGRGSRRCRHNVDEDDENGYNAVADTARISRCLDAKLTRLHSVRLCALCTCVPRWTIVRRFALTAGKCFVYYLFENMLETFMLES